MRKIMSKITSILLIVSMMMIWVTPAFATITNESAAIDEVAYQVEAANQVAQSLKDKGISVVVLDNGKIQLENISEDTINRANEILQSSLNTRASYPGPWVSMDNYDIYSSKSIIMSTKTAFITTLTAWIAGGLGINAAQLITVGVAGAIGYYWVMDDDYQDVYFYYNTAYREVGPGFFDENGTFYGDYELRKITRLTKNSDYTGGQEEIEYEYSTMIRPYY